LIVYLVIKQGKSIKINVNVNNPLNIMNLKIFNITVNHVE